MTYGSNSRDPEMDDLVAFHQRFLVPVADHPSLGISERERLPGRIAFLQEELDELRKATEAGDLAEIADALVDLVYVAKGTALILGLPWESHWDEVQNANMRKVPGATKRGMAYDVTKPAGWQPPNHADILMRSGYSQSDLVHTDCGLTTMHDSPEEDW